MSKYDSIKQQVFEANVTLATRGLAPFTFGNVSGIDRDAWAVAIKPSGVPYASLKAEDLVVTDLDGRVLEGTRKPSSDLPTHLVLYRSFKTIGGVAHAHSHYTTAWAQAGREIPCLGTTHADYFHGPVPVAGFLSDTDIAGDYESATGTAIVRRFAALDPTRMRAALVAGHGGFAWGGSAPDAVETMTLLETVARLAFDTMVLNPTSHPIPDRLRDKHYFRKHGPNAYYGQG